jgi:hypothetical protein
MACRIGVGALLVLGGLPLAAAAQVKPEWNFKKGDTFYVECLTTRKGSVTGSGKPLEQQAEQTLVARFTVVQAGDGQFVLEEKIESLTETARGEVVSPYAAAVSMGLVGYEKRATQGKEKEKVPGALFRITLRPDGEITKFEGAEGAVNKVVAAVRDLTSRDGRTPPQVEDLLKAVRTLVRPETLRTFAEDVFSILPNKEVKQGAGWERPMKVSLGPLGSVEGRKSYRYEGKDREGLRIGVEATLAYVLPRKETSAFPVQVRAGRLKADPARGTILFDAGAGRLVRSRIKIHFKGALTFQVGEKQRRVQLEQEQTVTIRVLDKNPLPRSAVPRE